MFKLRQQVVRRLAQRSVQWDVMSKKLTDPRARAAMESLRSTYSELENDAREYLKDPQPIDFDHYRKIIRNKDLVDVLEESYKTIKFPNITPEDLDQAALELPENERVNEKASLEKMMTDLDAQVEESKKRITELGEVISLMEQARTTLDTTMDEVSAMYPEIGEEIDDEIANYDWEKDTK